MAQAPLPSPKIAPITVTKDHDIYYPLAHAERLYWEACAAVALELNPGHPADLSPEIELELGAKDDFIDEHSGKDGYSAHVSLKEWNDEKFAYGVAVAARDTAISGEGLARIAHRVAVIVNATTQAK